MVIRWAKISLYYFLIVAVLGCLLRLLMFFPITGINFKNFLHAHSHVAFLGWVFNALFVSLIYAYIPEKAQKFKAMFLMLQVSVLGMMISFPIQGYAAVSVVFSTLHIFLSYWFAFKFLRNGLQSSTGGISVSRNFIRLALFFMVFSSIGPFSLGGIMASGLSGSIFYNLSIYFYLHFQYNGWFSFALLGMFFWFLETRGIEYNQTFANVFFWLMAIACIPSYALSALWIQPSNWVYVLAFLSALLQIIALLYLGLLLTKIKALLKLQLDPFIYKLFCFSLASFALKILLQFASAFPAVVKRNAFQAGMYFLLIGFLGSEAMVFLQPLSIFIGAGIISFGNEIIFSLSIFMPLGIAVILSNIEFRMKNKKEIKMDYPYHSDQLKKDIAKFV